MEFESISPTFTKPLNKKEINFIESYSGSIPYILDKIWLKDIIKTYKNIINIFPYTIDFTINSDNIPKNYTKFKNLFTNESKILNDNDRLNLFKKNDKYKYTIFTVGFSGIDNNDKMYGHSNILILDHTTNIIERFEPHGIFENNIILNNNINDKYKIIIKNILGLNSNFEQNFICPLQSSDNMLKSHKKYKNYINNNSNVSENDLKNFLINISIEYKEEDKGYCTMFSYWYVLYKLKYQILSNEEFHKLIIKKLKDQSVIKYIRHYTHYVIKELYKLAEIYNINYKNNEESNDEEYNPIEYIQHELKNNKDYLNDYNKFLQDNIKHIDLTLLKMDDIEDLSDDFCIPFNSNQVKNYLGEQNNKGYHGWTMIMNKNKYALIEKSNKSEGLCFWFKPNTTYKTDIENFVKDVQSLDLNLRIYWFDDYSTDLLKRMNQQFEVKITPIKLLNKILHFLDNIKVINITINFHPYKLSIVKNKITIKTSKNNVLHVKKDIKTFKEYFSDFTFDPSELSDDEMSYSESDSESDSD